MILDGKNFNEVICNAVDEAVRIVYATAPKFCQIPFQRFGFSDSFVWRTFDIMYKLIYSLERFLVLSLPVKVIVPSLFRPYLFH